MLSLYQNLFNNNNNNGGAGLGLLVVKLLLLNIDIPNLLICVHQSILIDTSNDSNFMNLFQSIFKRTPDLPSFTIMPQDSQFSIESHVLTLGKQVLTIFIMSPFTPLFCVLCKPVSKCFHCTKNLSFSLWISLVNKNNYSENSGFAQFLK